MSARAFAAAADDGGERRGYGKKVTVLGNGGAGECVGSHAKKGRAAGASTGLPRVFRLKWL